MGVNQETKGLEIITYEGEGYQTLMSFQSWKVAMVSRPAYEFGKPIANLSRHMETDEVFLLLAGKGKLYTAGNEEDLSEVVETVFEPMKLYNVKKGTWHAHSLEEGAKLLIVENSDTGDNNSEFLPPIEPLL